MADSESNLRSMAWSSVLLGVALAAAQVAWSGLNDDRLGRPAADGAYLALTGLAVLAWLLVVGCGLIALVSGRLPGRGFAAVAAASAGLAAVIALVLLALTASGDYADDAFNDVLLQSWPLLPLLLFAGDWVRRSRTGAPSPV